MRAIFAGAFDPFTVGHLDIAVRALKIFGNVTVAVADDTGKFTASLSDRLEIAKASIGSLENAEVVSFKGLLPEFLKRNAPCVLVRGIRGSVDAEYERDLSRVYGSFCDAERVYLFADACFAHVSSSCVRALCAVGADLNGYAVPAAQETIKKIYGCKR